MEVKEQVREKYGQTALRVKSGGSCCGSAPSSVGCVDPISSNLYDSSQTSAIPEEAVLASLGCGNPTALAKLNPGETVLDLGSGGGIDVLLSARRVGPTGIPLPDNSVDVVISNYVINLSADKDRVLREAFRVLKPGGRFAVSDVVARGQVPATVRQNVLLWVGCIAGALEEYEYVAKLAKAGFDGIEIEPTRVYNIEDARAFLTGPGRAVWLGVTCQLMLARRSAVLLLGLL